MPGSKKWDSASISNLPQLAMKLRSAFLTLGMCAVFSAACGARADDVAPPPATQPTGLNALGDDALLSELASRGLDDLLKQDTAALLARLPLPE